METVTLVGVILIVLGIVVLLFQGIPFTREKHVIAISPLKASVEEKKTIPVSPVLGVVAVAAGAALLVLGSRKR